MFVSAAVLTTAYVVVVPADLKAKRYVEAIDVCQKVLRQYPDYKGIQKEILEKCFQSLRP